MRIHFLLLALPLLWQHNCMIQFFSIYQTCFRAYIALAKCRSQIKGHHESKAHRPLSGLTHKIRSRGIESPEPTRLTPCCYKWWSPFVAFFACPNVGIMNRGTRFRPWGYLYSVLGIYQIWKYKWREFSQLLKLSNGSETEIRLAEKVHITQTPQKNWSGQRGTKLHSGSIYYILINTNTPFSLQYKTTIAIRKPDKFAVSASSSTPMASEPYFRSMPQ